MELFEKALQYDVNKKYIEAAPCYEASIIAEVEKAPVDCFINLAFMYWLFAFDYTISKYDNLPDEWSLIGGARYQKILDYGKKFYPHNMELLFWDKYFQSIIYSKKFTVNECEDIVYKNGGIESYVPFFMLHQYNNEKYKNEVNQLVNECRNLPTAKNRYILSVLHL